MITEERVIEFFREAFSVLDEDVGVYKLSEKYILFNIDTFVESSDKPYAMTFHSAGYKSIISTLSDLMVKGAEPICLAVSIGFRDLAAAEIKEIRDGIIYALSKYGLNINIIKKWDTNYSEDLFISVAGVGLAYKTPPYRSNAKPGDIICVDGGFGLETLGLRILMHKDIKIIYNLPHLLKKKAIERFMYPEPKLISYKNIIDKFNVNASIDSSDGLARSLNLISKNSKVKVIINKIPIDDTLQKYRRYFADEYMMELVFYGGEEYKGIFIISYQGSIENLEKETGLKCIGYIEEGKGVFITKNGKKELIRDKGFIHKL